LRHRDKRDIETSGFAARFYDQLLIIFTVGLYHKLLKAVIHAMNIQPEDHILDMGAGTGKNALFMQRYLKDGSITALEIGREMKRQLNRKCGKYKNIYLENLRIDKPLPFKEQFDKVFISYVLHGFGREDRAVIVQNAFQALKPDGKLLIFDWNKFDLQESGPIMRFFMHHIECEPATDFIREDLPKVLSYTGFSDIENHLYFRNQIRLLSCMK